LLKELCDILPRKQKFKGRKGVEVAHIIFCLCMKNYCIKSGRRIIGELELCKEGNLIEKVPHFNSLYNYLKNKNLTFILEDLIKLTSLPLKAIERKFCCDSTGFGTEVIHERWSQIRSQYEKHHKYYKAHIAYGVLTNIVTACKVTEGERNDAPMLPELVNETAENFKLEEWSADKGYLSRENYNAIFEKGAIPFIPFKSNTTDKKRNSGIWQEMYNFFKDNNELFMKKYHLRSNAESGMQMIKSRFGDLTSMRNETAGKNDILCKILCHNLCVLCQELLLLGIDINFAQYSELVAQDRI
jgi:transposase